MPSRHDSLAAFDRRVVGELGPSFRTGRHNFLLLFLLIGACIFITLITIRFPLLLTFTSTSFLLLGLCMRPVGNRIQLSGSLKDNKQDKSRSTDLQQNRMDET